MDIFFCAFFKDCANSTVNWFNGEEMCLFVIEICSCIFLNREAKI